MSDHDANDCPEAQECGARSSFHAPRAGLHRAPESESRLIRYLEAHET